MSVLCFMQLISGYICLFNEAINLVNDQRYSLYSLYSAFGDG